MRVATTETTVPITVLVTVAPVVVIHHLHAHLQTDSSVFYVVVA